MEERYVVTPDGVRLHVADCGDGPDVLVLSGGPGLVNHLADEALAPDGFRCWWPTPRGVAPSGGGPHSMLDAVADLETLRAALGVEVWAVVGHSWGSDLAVRSALDRPLAVRQVVGVAGHGLHNDRTWSAVYAAGKASEPVIDIVWDEDVGRALLADFGEWIHEPDLWRRLADCAVPMVFLTAGSDIRPAWPLRQLAALVPDGRFSTIAGVPHDLWHTHPDVWRSTIDAALRDA
jgi:proline iminopeptidase